VGRECVDHGLQRQLAPELIAAAEADLVYARRITPEIAVD